MSVIAPIEQAPAVSVVLPVYNGAAYVQSAVLSILGQSWTDFELIIINDGSKDASGEIVDALCDARIRVFHQQNRGLAATLNRGIELARGRYIARQDQDDLSLPERFARQVAYLDANPDCVLLGTAAEIWVGDHADGRAHDHPTDHAALAFELLFNNPFVHSSVMMRRDAVLAVGGYTTDPARQPPEDYELWSRLARYGRVANLPERLLVYREVPASMSRTGPNPFLTRLVMLCTENLAMLVGDEAPVGDLKAIASLTHSTEEVPASALPPIKRLCGWVRLAAQRIAQGRPDAALAARVESHVVTLRHQYALRRHGLAWARPILRALRGVARRVVRARG